MAIHNYRMAKVLDLTAPLLAWGGRIQAALDAWAAGTAVRMSVPYNRDARWNRRMIVNARRSLPPPSLKLIEHLPLTAQAALVKLISI